MVDNKDYLIPLFFWIIGSLFFLGILIPIGIKAKKYGRPMIPEPPKKSKYNKEYSQYQRLYPQISFVRRLK